MKALEALQFFAIPCREKRADMGHPSRIDRLWWGGSNPPALLYCGGNTCMSNLPGKTRLWRSLVVLLQARIAHLHI